MHHWQESGRLPVTLVRSVCDCGCRGQRIRIAAADGREMAFDVPAFAKVQPETLRKFQQGVTIGQALLAFWDRVKSVAL